MRTLDTSASTRGVLLSIIMASSYSFLTLALKLFLENAPGRSPTTALIFRYGTTVFILLIYAYYKGATLIPMGSGRDLLIRGTLAAAASGGFAFSLVYLNVGPATVINYTSTMMAGPISYWLIGEPWKTRDMAASVLSIVGVAFISISGTSGSTASSLGKSDSATGSVVGISLGLLSALTNALQMVHIRKISAKPGGSGLDSLQIIFAGYLGMAVLSILLWINEHRSFAMGSTIASLPPEALTDNQPSFSAYDGLLVACFTLFGLIGQLCSILAAALIPAVRLLLIGTLQVVLSFAFQISMGRNASLLELSGASCVVGGVLLAAAGGETSQDVVETVAKSPKEAGKQDWKT